MILKRKAGPLTGYGRSIIVVQLFQDDYSPSGSENEGNRAQALNFGPAKGSGRPITATTPENLSDFYLQSVVCLINTDVIQPRFCVFCKQLPLSQPFVNRAQMLQILLRLRF